MFKTGKETVDGDSEEKPDAAEKRVEQRFSTVFIGSHLFFLKLPFKSLNTPSHEVFFFFYFLHSR